jgi:hypothetical protein
LKKHVPTKPMLFNPSDVGRLTVSGGSGSV